MATAEHVKSHLGIICLCPFNDTFVALQYGKNYSYVEVSV